MTPKNIWCILYFKFNYKILVQKHIRHANIFDLIIESQIPLSSFLLDQKNKIITTNPKQPLFKAQPHLQHTTHTSQTLIAKASNSTPKKLKKSTQTV